jgi:hypothetical protein
VQKNVRKEGRKKETNKQAYKKTNEQTLKMYFMQLEIVVGCQERVATGDSLKRALVTGTFHFCSDSVEHFPHSLVQPQNGTRFTTPPTQAQQHSLLM